MGSAYHLIVKNITPKLNENLLEEKEIWSGHNISRLDSMTFNCNLDLISAWLSHGSERCTFTKVKILSDVKEI